MAAGTTPIFSIAPRSSFAAAITAANTAMDGTGTVNLVFTAGSNGSFLSRLIVRALGTNVATVMRIFLNNGSTPTVAGNNALIAEINLPATTASNTTQQPDFQIPLNMGIEPSYRIYATLGTTVAAGWIPTIFGGDY